MARSPLFVAVLFSLALSMSGCGEPPSTEPSAIVERRLTTMLSSGRIIADPGLPYTIHVKDVSGLKMTEVVFKQKNARGVIEIVVHAQEGNFRVDVPKKRLILTLRKGSTLAKSGARDTFLDRAYDLPLSDNFFKE